MDLDLQWLLIGLPVAFALGWLASRLDLKQLKRARDDSPRAYFKVYRQFKMYNDPRWNPELVAESRGR